MNVLDGKRQEMKIKIENGKSTDETYFNQGEKKRWGRKKK